MKITVVSFWYNEALLAPFFLSHYAFADRILLFLDKTTTDNSREICAAFPNVEIEEMTFPGGKLDDGLKIAMFNQTIAGLNCDWAYAVDADEFAFPRNGEDPRVVLARQTGNVMKTELLNVYRHTTDVDLDYAHPSLAQRRHGDPVVQRGYDKPVIVKPETQIEWTPGNHYYKPNVNIRELGEDFAGAHWQWADLNITLTRKLTQKGRLSARNLASGWGTEYLALTEANIRQHCAEHANDPLLFEEGLCRS